MGKTLRTHRSTLHALEMIVTNGSGRLHTSLDVCVVNDVALGGAMRPYACETVSLKFKIDGKAISL